MSVSSGSSPPAWWAPEDRRVLRKLLTGYLYTTLLPVRLDPWLVPKLIRRRVPLSRFENWPGMTEVERRMRFALEGLRPDLDFRAEAAHFDEMRIETEWLLARALHRREPSVRTRVDGLEHLRTHPVDGPGSILWGMSFCATMAVKIALARAGVSLVHLSHVGHGAAYPPTRFGTRVVSPLYCKAEDRFLAERVRIPMDESLGYLRTLIGRLEAGRVVYIAGERLALKQNTTAECLGRPTPFARGAPGLAHRTKSPLLPVTVYREGTLDYSVVIEPPIEADYSAPRAAFVEEAIQRFADRVSRNVLDHPRDWDWYRHTVPAWEAREA